MKKTQQKQRRRKPGHAPGHAAGQQSPNHASRDTWDTSLVSRVPSGSAMIEHLDRIATELELVWGGHLQNHVAPELKAKFEAQQQKLDDAIASGDDELIAKRASAMARAWRALDAAARADGIKPADEALWIGKRRDGQLVCIYTSAAQFSVLPDHMPRFYIDELVNMIPTAALKAKEVWPDATIEGINKRDLDDEIPF
jgi:hypothetical protein